MSFGPNMIQDTIRIATRGSKLALWQAHDLQAKLEQIDIPSELVIIKTKGDEIQHLSFDKIEGKGFFTKEIEDALLADMADIAVHSLKDLPTSSHDDLVTAGLSERQDPSDIIIADKSKVDLKRPLRLMKGSRIGTSSIRRKTQLLAFDTDLTLVDIRGNVPTRIQKIGMGEVDAIVIAAAGVNRLGIDLRDYWVLKLNPIEFIPAPAQGVIAYQCRRGDMATRKVISQIHSKETASTTNIERKILKLMEGGCQTPIGVYCTRDNQNFYHCHAVKGTQVGEPLIRFQYSSSTSAGFAEHIVEQLSL